MQERILRVLERACDEGILLATAESCTGGLLASLLTDVDGCSHAFDRGFVVYTDEAKRQMLGVPADMLERHSAVSKPVAIAMAEGAIASSSAEIAVSITGFAGPGGEGAEEGLVHFGCARRGRETVHREERFGALGRGGVRLRCIETGVTLYEEMMT
ncbi:CinA family protein [Rhodobacteraceae bacterium MCCB 386]|nr:CinA family protein [Roseitranquillus sediminis]